MVIIAEEPGYPGDFGKSFDSDGCLEAARALYEGGSTVTPPGVVSLIDLSHELHRAYGRLGRVLEAAGWFETPEHPGYFFPPELKRGLE